MNTDNAVNIRPASGVDVPELVALLYVLFTQEADFTPDTARQERALRQIIDSPGVGIIFVACNADNFIIGMVSLLLTVSTVTGGCAAWLEDMIVAPQVRREGIGSSLLGHAIGWAEEHGITRITLLTDANNAHAQRFYQRHGFQPSSMMTLRLPLVQD